MKKLIVSVVAAFSAVVMVAPVAHAGSACYSVQATVNGSDVVNEAGCVDLP